MVKGRAAEVVGFLHSPKVCSSSYLLLGMIHSISSDCLDPRWTSERFRCSSEVEIALQSCPPSSARWRWVSRVQGQSGASLEGQEVWPLLLLHVLLPGHDENLSDQHKWFFEWAVSSGFWDLEARSFPTEDFDNGFFLLCGLTREQFCWHSG